MNHATMFAALVVVASLSACQKPEPVNVPPATVGEPGPAGSQGSTGKPGDAGTAGGAPAASSSSN